MEKVLVGCPTSDHKEYCINEYAQAVKSLTYKNYDVLLVDNSEKEDYSKKVKSLGLTVIKDKFQEHARDRIISSRNILREYVLKNNYDYLLSLEQDVIPHKDVIETLLSHNLKIVSGVVCHMRAGKLRPMLWTLMNEEDYKFIKSNPENFPKTIEELKRSNEDYKKIIKQLQLEDVEEPRLLSNLLICSLSCVLIHRSVLEKVKFRYTIGEEAYDDVWFCRDARDSGFKMYCDASVKCKHLIKQHQDWSKINK